MAPSMSATGKAGPIPTTRAARSRIAPRAPYGSGIYFVVTIDDKAGWGLGFAHEKWTLTIGQAFPIVLTFDGQTPFNVHGSRSATNWSGADADNSALIAQFRKAKAMTAFTQGQLFQFKLDQTAQLLPALANCVASVRKNGVASRRRVRGCLRSRWRRPGRRNRMPRRQRPQIRQPRPVPVSSSAAADTWSPTSTWSTAAAARSSEI